MTFAGEQRDWGSSLQRAPLCGKLQSATQNTKGAICRADLKPLRQPMRGEVRSEFIADGIDLGICKRLVTEQ
jgi:hypothetical protein